MVTTLLGSEISSSQWKGPTMHSRCHTFVPFCVWGEGKGEGGRIFFHFSMVPNVLPNMFSIASNFCPICFGKYCPPFTYISGPKRRYSILQNRTLYFVELT
jgi:hypothetical protein